MNIQTVLDVIGRIIASARHSVMIKIKMQIINLFAVYFVGMVSCFTRQSQFFL